MAQAKHGLSIGIERASNTVFLSIKAVGKLTHSDYEFITPLVDSAIACIQESKIDVLLDGTELVGWELRAAWDDFKLGLKHKKQFHRIAILGNKKWQQIGAKAGNWFISGEVRYFEESSDALLWLAE